MSSKRFKGVVPWYNPEQFHKVYRYLYGFDLSEKRKAVDQISIWETRCHPCLPTSVEATVVLVRACIQDRLFQAGATFCQDRDIQMIYAMALVRFINLTIELEQTTKKKIPLSVIAEKCQIPAWIVNLRNEATHSLLPSLPVLRLGAEKALEHLDKTFWLPEVSSLHSWIKSPEANEQEIRTLICSFQVHQFDKLMKGIPFDTEDDIQQDLMEKINWAIRRYRRKFIEIFVQTDVFTLAEDVMKDILGDHEKKFIYDDIDCLLPKTFEDFWMPVIVVLHSNALIPTFLEILLSTQEHRELIEQKYVIAWAIRIVQSVALFDKSNAHLSYIFQQQGSVFDWSKLLFLCLKYPCKYTAFLFPLLVSLLELNEEWTRRFMYLVAIHQGQAIDKSNFAIEDHVFTVEDIKRDRKRKYCPKEENVWTSTPDTKRKYCSKEENLWTVAPDHIDFSKLPIGAVLNAAVDRKNASSEEISDDEIMDVNDSDERFIINYVNDKQDDENIDINSSKKDESTNSSKNEENVYMVYKRR